MDTQHMEEKLWHYIDGNCTAAEKAETEALLKTDPWKAKYAELYQLHQLINLSEPEEPSLRFMQNVMEEIGRYKISPATKSYLNIKIIYNIGGFFMVMIVGLLAYGFGQIDWSSTGSSVNVPVELQQFEWNRIFNNTNTSVFMMVNVILGLMLLDNYLTRRKGKVKHR